MKKNLKGLKLNKKSISNFQFFQLKGGDRATDDITNCGALCAQEIPKTVDGCRDFTSHTSVNPMGGIPSNCDH